jgi:dihydrofolate reductase
VTGKVIAGITMSLDGFVCDQHGSLAKLYSDFDMLQEAPAFQAAIRDTGAVVMGRRAFAMGDPDAYADHYEFQVPIFVLTHAAPTQHPKESSTLTFTFVTAGLEQALTQAKQAAAGKDVQVIGGPDTIRQCLRARLCDELHIDLVPVLLGEGLRLFDGLDPDGVTLERISSAETTPVRTSFVFRVVR